MKRRRMLAALLGALMPLTAAAEDPGREVLGRIKVDVFFGTDGDPKVAGPKAVEVDEATAKRLSHQEPLRFGHYRLLGTDTKPLYRSYENWAQPIAGTEEILCRFEVETRLANQKKRLDLELWLSHKKILKTGVVMGDGKPVLVLGPEWRGGRLIFVVELAPAGNAGK